MSKTQDTYIHERTIEHSNCIIRIFRPVLTEDERARRMKAIHKAAEGLLKETMKIEREKSNGSAVDYGRQGNSGRFG